MAVLFELIEYIVLVSWVSRESHLALLRKAPWIDEVSEDGVQLSLAQGFFDCTKRFSVPNIFAQKNLRDLVC